MQINNIVIAGRLTKPVEYSATKDGTPASRFTLANTRGRHVNYVTVVSFDKTADYAKNYLHKGQRVTVVGVLNHHIVQSDGDYKDYWSIVADTFDVIHPKPHQSKSVRDLYSKLGDLNKKIDAASDTKKTTRRHKK